MRTRGKWLSKNSFLWDSNEDQDASGIARELIVGFLCRSFTLKTTKLGPKSKIRCVPLLETVNCIVLIVKERVVILRKVWKMKRKVNLYCDTTADSNEKRFLHIRWFLCVFSEEVHYQLLLLLSWRVLIGGCTFALEARVSVFGDPIFSFSQSSRSNQVR